MKKIIRYLSVSLISLIALSGCIRETFPLDGRLNPDQLAKGDIENMTAGFHIYMKTHAIVSADNDNNFGYPALMIAMEHLGQDMSTNSDYYSSWWVNSWYSVNYLGKDYIYGQYFWTFYYKINLIANDILAGIPNPETASANAKVGYGIASFFKAWLYFDLVRLYAAGTYMTNPDAISAIIFENDTPDATNNPRVTAQVMYDKIIEYLDKALIYLEGYNTAGSAERDFTRPNLATAHGLYARVALTMGDWEGAKQHAIAAQVGYRPTTEAEGTHVTTGFNTATNAWLWGLQQYASDDCVQTGILNWTSWMSSEASYGYAGAGTGEYRMIDRALYSQIPSTDWRKKWFESPAGGVQSESNSPYKSGIISYAPVKFRVGGGAYDDYEVGSATAIPLMRVEEMMLIEAEAAGRQNLADGISRLNNFVQTYRDASFVSQATDEITFINEVWLQRRIELWGEGQAIFDLKRLNKGVTRAYKDAGGKETNHYPGFKYNTALAPDWLTFAIVQTEQNGNPGMGDNNPDPIKPNEVAAANYIVVPFTLE